MELNEILSFDYEYAAYTTQELIGSAATLPIHQFDQDILPGKVLEIGYRMGGLVLYYASQGRQVHALDREPYFERRLKERLDEQPYRDLVSFSLASMPDGELPQESFAIISICHVLHYFDFGTAQLIIDRLSNRLMPGGWIVTKNHHKSHLYSNNPGILGPDQEYKHFFSEEEIVRLFLKQVFTEKYNKAEDHLSDEKEQMVKEHYWSLHPQYSREWLKEKYIDIEYHTDIVTVHQKKQ
jgi:cyclopropane fatty-acyl-phospholipid synthase-like methyltransferase